MSQPSRRGWHCWKLQGQPFAFCRRFETACIFWKWLSTCTWSFFSTCDQVWKKISTKKTGVLCLRRNPTSTSASEANTAIHCSRWRCSSTVERYSPMIVGGRFIHGLVKQLQFCVSFIALWQQNGNFQTSQSWKFLYQYFFRSLPVVMNLG